MPEENAGGDRLAPISIQQFLKGASYPATKDELLETARRNNAPREVVDVLERMERDRFGGPQDVQKGYGEVG